MTKEEIYADQMRALGTYDPAFEPEIHQLAILEREQARARKAWKATVPKGGTPSMLDKHYELICKLTGDILAHRDALGLTPKGLQRLRGKEPAQTATSGVKTAEDAFQFLADKVADYE